MKIPIVAIIIFLNIFCFLISYSQDFIDVFNLGSNYSPYNKYKKYDNKVSLTESFANLKIPVQLENSNVFIFGLSINSLKFDNQPKIENNENYYSTSVELGYIKTWNEKLNTLFMLIPKLSSDFKNIRTEDYQVGGVLLFTIKKEENLKYKFGVYYNSEFFGPFFVPLLGIDWHPVQEVRIFGNLPVTLTCEYKPNEKLAGGIFFKSPAGSYRLGEEYNKDYLQKTSQELSVFIDTYMSKNIVLTFKAGRTIGRYYRLYSQKDKLKAKISFYNIGDTRQQLNQDFKDGFFYEVRMSYRLSI